MASIKISNLPAVTPGTLTDDDQFVLNDANQTTSRLSYGNLKSRFLGENHTFAGSVNFTGDVNVNVNSTNTNVLTIQSATVLIEESEARSNVLIQQNAADITNLVSFTGSAGNSVIGNGIWKLPALQASNPNNLFNAVKVIDGALELTDITVTGHTTSIADINNTITGIQTELTTVKDDLDALEALVTGIGGLQEDVNGNTNNLTQLSTDVTNLGEAVGFTGAIANNIQGLIPTSGPVAGSQTIGAALTALNTQVVANQTEIQSNDSDIADAAFARARMHANTAHIFTKILAACSGLPAGSTANDFATLIASELGVALPNPDPENG